MSTAMKEKNFKRYCNMVIEEFKDKVEVGDDNDKLKEIIELIEQWEPDIDYSTKDDWESCCGSKNNERLRTYTLYMCGGCAEWYNYIIDISGNVFKESGKGKEYLKDAVVYSNEDGDYIMIGDENDEGNLQGGEMNLSEMVMNDMFE